MSGVRATHVNETHINDSHLHLLSTACYIHRVALPHVAFFFCPHAFLPASDVHEAPLKLSCRGVFFGCGHMAMFSIL